MGLPCLSVPGEDTAYLGAQEEEGLRRAGTGYGIVFQVLAQREKAVAQRVELACKLPEPPRMHGVSRADDGHPLKLRPLPDDLGHHVPACRDGVTGMDVKIGNESHLYAYRLPLLNL